MEKLIKAAVTSCKHAYVPCSNNCFECAAILKTAFEANQELVTMRRIVV